MVGKSLLFVNKNYEHRTVQSENVFQACMGDGYEWKIKYEYSNSDFILRTYMMFCNNKTKIQICKCNVSQLISLIIGIDHEAIQILEHLAMNWLHI